MHYTVHPHVAGVLGERASVDRGWFPALVLEAHVELTGWSGDDLLAVSVIFLVTERLRAGLQASGLTGAMFAPAEVSEGGTPVIDPPLTWLQLWGTPGVDDLWLGPGLTLSVSARAKTFLDAYRLQHARIDQRHDQLADRVA